MLTDIFANRYADVPLWTAFTETEKRLVVQLWRLASEDLVPHVMAGGKQNPNVEPFWKDIQERLSRELGMTSLSALTYTYNYTFVGNHTMEHVCGAWMLQEFDAQGGIMSCDRYMKERLSLIELAFRRRDRELEIEKLEDAKLVEALRERFRTNPKIKGLPVPPPGPSKPMRDVAAHVERVTHELNERLRQAKCRLHYHNGFIQHSTDELTIAQIEQPFWSLVADAKWKNVDTDMKEAVDRRNANDRDPALYAAKALESTIKVISDERGWTTGSERGAANYIANLVSKNNGSFIDVWEGEIIRSFFSNVRNPLGHGPGSAPPVALSEAQDNWAIDFCMGWIKSLISRL